MIFALESSCDETAIAAFEPGRGLAGEWLLSQIALHGKHGGVVPDLATREHLRNIPVLLALAKERIDMSGIESLAVTRGPGLAACLAMGVASAKALSLALRVPLVGVNHLRAHALSPFIPIHGAAPQAFGAAAGALLPHLGLIVSGGNTLLLSMDEKWETAVLASTRDDAAGEALDKGAKLLGLGYPGGPVVESIAASGSTSAYDFPRGMSSGEDVGFSFSGLKTSLRYLIEKMSTEEIRARMPDLCASYQQAVVDALVRKTGQAWERGAGRYRSLGLSGGVANNRILRAAFEKLSKKAGIPFLPALPAHTGDNAGMIAFAAWIDREREGVASGLGLAIEPSLAL